MSTEAPIIYHSLRCDDKDLEKKRSFYNLQRRMKRKGQFFDHLREAPANKLMAEVQEALPGVSLWLQTYTINFD